MSRVGKYPVIVPDGVKVVVEGNLVKASGKLGELSQAFDADHVAVEINENKVVVTPKGETKMARALWGTTRANINVIVKGVSEGFSKNLELVGVGYKARVEGSNKLFRFAIGIIKGGCHAKMAGAIAACAIKKRCGVRLCPGAKDKGIAFFTADIDGLLQPTLVGRVALGIGTVIVQLGGNIRN